MPTEGKISPAMALAHACPGFVASLTPKERIVWATMNRQWLRPAQVVPDQRFTTLRYSGARGWGKSFAFGVHLNDFVAQGIYTKPALMGANEERTYDVQVKTLIETAPLWNVPSMCKDRLVWPNGVEAELFTAEAPGRSRGSTFDVSWMCEIVDWQASTRDDAFNNLFTATRADWAPYGAARTLIDTTSKGQNSVIQRVVKMHLDNPRDHLVVNGTTFDNHRLTEAYLRGQCANYTIGSRRYREEILGEIFDSSAGALWEMSWIANNRRPVPPANPKLVLVSVDPAITIRETSDDTGYIVGALGQDDHAYVMADTSGRHKTGDWVRMAVDRCALDAAGIIVETNRGGMVWQEAIQAHVGSRAMRLVVLKPGEAFPMRRPGTVFLREVTSRKSKIARAEGPADLGRAGLVHHCGEFPELETELTTWEQGSGDSPNRLDAHAQLISELQGLMRPMAQDHGASIAVAQELNQRLARLISPARRRTGL